MRFSLFYQSNKTQNLSCTQIKDKQQLSKQAPKIVRKNNTINKEVNKLT